MPFVLRNLTLPLDEPEANLPLRIARRLRMNPMAIRHYAVVRRSIDARKDGDVVWAYNVEVALRDPRDERAAIRRLNQAEAAWIDPVMPELPVVGEAGLDQPPLIVGFGPAGMFAAMRLAEMGYRPVVIERGRDVRRRHKDIMQRFYRERDFDPVSNLLYGEGGAGTYSDGKLYTRRHEPLVREVLETLYRFGADPEMLVASHPHIGSDRLPTICTRMREAMVEMGAEVRFEQQLDDVEVSSDGRLKRVSIGGVWQKAGPVMLAVGHSARDTLRMLHARGVQIETKPFQLGVRIEHPQAMVDRWQYGAACGHPNLGAAEYFVVAKKAAGDAGDMFSFCMCPGGQILPTNECAGLVATNGASKANRSSPFANSGLVMTVDPAALGLDAMGGLAMQEALERKAFEVGGGDYRVPMQRASDFLAGRASDGLINVSYPLGGSWSRLGEWLPPALTAALQRGLPMLGRNMPGYAGDEAMITAPETRASAPIRIVRDSDTRESVSASGLYPAGEGAGYAGGIVSAAIDGIKSADAIIRKYAPFK